MKKWLIVCFLFFSNQIIASAEQIVDTDKEYTPQMLKEDIVVLEEMYPKLIKSRLLGYSHYGREIWGLKLGNGEPSVLIHGAHHGREWLTTSLIMKMIESYCERYTKQEKVDRYSPEILNKISIWFVPMVNPDGVAIQQLGLNAVPKEDTEKLLGMNDGSQDFKRWKANGVGIDLNRQYPAGWDMLKGTTTYPYYKMYKGQKPLMAREVMLLTNLTKEINPEIAIAYHSSGQEIFGDFTKGNKKFAKRLASITKYRLSEPQDTAAGGGYTDWFIQEYKRPGYTLEITPIVEETNPPLSSFQEAWDRNEVIGLMTAYEGYRLWERKQPTIWEKWFQLFKEAI